MCMKNEKQVYYPTVIIRLCCGYHLVRYRYGIENGAEMEWEWRSWERWLKRKNAEK